MSDYRSLLAGDQCWDQSTEELFRTHGEPLQDAILQNREELIALCELIEAHRIRSYLEIGTWTGRLISALHRLFGFEVVAACDHGWAAELGLGQHLPPETLFFAGESGSSAFARWRHELGPIDLVMIDANHSLRAVRRDFALNRAQPFRFLAFHDITGARPATRGVKRFWDQLDE